MGWFILSLVDTALAIDESLYYEFRRLKEMLYNLANDLLKFQDDSGMFYQLVDRKGDKDNYLETSGSALISYAFLKAARNKLLPKRFEDIGKKIFDGILDRYLCVEGEERSLGGICLVAGLGGKENRDGSAEYYYSEPVVKNEAKGVAPLLMAYTEIIRLGMTYD